MNEFKIITGTALEVEKKLNELGKEKSIVCIGISATNEQTTVLVQTFDL